MVIVIPKNLHDARRAREPRVRADEDEGGPRGHEAVDEILGQAVLDLARDEGWPLAPVSPRVVDVDVEPILMRRVAGPEGASPPAAEVADPEAWRRRMRLCVTRDDTEDLADEEVRPPSPPGPVGAAMEERIPREEARAGRRELYPAHEPSCRRRPDSAGIAPAHRPVRLCRRRRAALLRRRSGETQESERQDDQANCPH